MRAPRWRPVLMVAGAWALGACQGGRNAGNGDAAPGAVAGADSPWISFERGPCFGTCPVYALQVSRQGVVTFEGKRFVRDSGRVVDTLAADSVRALAAAIEEAGFFGFAPMYRHGEPVCPVYATDMPSVVTSVISGERTHRVEHDRGCQSAPKSLTTLEERIDSIVRTWRWTTGRPQS